ncbi:LapA family protein [Aquabacterium sp. A7-Y]|uniref:LapA family protein n=1 Tax=Aquabacterium sp. A7-Y TaxID=1349605 RepID=UPI00223D6204|nr:LapA family protein [Aquabacterium sp. A7-Y]MCW7536491.1 LapA family protein [Aquabacterium sp. A7-Y]
MRALLWLLRAAIFFLLFAFALNNQHEAVLHWFFGYQSQAPTVFIVLAAFALGCVFGVLAMVPSWWRHRRAARQLPSTSSTEAPAAAPAPVAAEDEALPLMHPPRDGL